MSRIFISHASEDARAAVALKEWLAEQEPQLVNEIFLDIDPVTGLRAGTQWRRELFSENSRCETLICLLSANWLTSHECGTEFRTAEGFGKRIICARLEDVTDQNFTSEWQRLDLFGDGAKTPKNVPGGPAVEFRTAALYQLRDLIAGQGTGPEYFVWPVERYENRAPYRGFEPFEEIDAGVFFGRDAAILHGLEELRGMRKSGLKSLFVVLGPSGSGKSSFLRAGLLPRLRKEDRLFKPLGILRPASEPLTGHTGLAAAIHTARNGLSLRTPSLGDVRAACKAGGMQLFALVDELREVAAERLVERGQEGLAPTLVLPLDQTEELFSADARETPEFVAALSQLLEHMNSVDIGLIVASTIRTDRFEVMQNHPVLGSINTVLFDKLKAMPATQFREVITGPALRTANAPQQVTIAPDLVDRIVEDASEGADALPLLSLTLSRLYHDYCTEGELTLRHYDEGMGGMGDIVNREIADVLATDPLQRATDMGLLRLAFPWLVTINADTERPLRREARYRDLPEASRPLVDALRAKRLLVQDTRNGEVVVEVALESVLRQWKEMAEWLEEHRPSLKIIDDVVRGATAWDKNHRHRDWLVLRGTRLTEAETVAATPEFSQRLAATADYLKACREAETRQLQEADSAQARARPAQRELTGGRIFLSHSASDTRQAVALKQWLADKNPSLGSRIFLNVDAGTGIAPGVRWKDTLRQANMRAAAVLCLLSANWAASAECRTEYRTAETLNKQILCARLEPSAADDLTAEWQRCDLFGDGPKTVIDVGEGPPVQFETAGLQKIRWAIEGITMGEAFVWPPPNDPNRAPYRGWEPFEDIDAGVFFGRSAAIQRALDELRRMHQTGSDGLFVILGRSGCGKSSFLRAGLIPRLQRDDRHYLVLDIVRPEHDALGGDAGFAAALHKTRLRFGLTSPSFDDIERACIDDSDRVVELLLELHNAAAARLLGENSSPSLVLPLDQADELFRPSGAAAADRFLALLGELVRRLRDRAVGLIVVATIRTDRYEIMQSHPALNDVNTVLFDELKPMPRTQFKEVITGPATRASEVGRPLQVADDLVERLLDEASNGVDLPLLSLTLSRLYADYGVEGRLTLAQYEAMGGVHRVLNTEIDAILSRDPTERGQQLEALRLAFIPWLVTIDPNNDRPVPNIMANYADLPELSRSLIDALVWRRLLVCDVRDGRTVVEVASESLLHQWDQLTSWLREERQNLMDVHEIERSASAWANHDHDPAWLLRGSRLVAAESLATTAQFRMRLAAAHDFLSACRRAEEAAECPRCGAKLTRRSRSGN